MCRNGIKGKSITSLLTSMGMNQKQLNIIEGTVNFPMDIDPTKIGSEGLNKLFCLDHRVVKQKKRFGLF